MNPLKILVVEDETLIAESLRDVLNILDHEVAAIATNGEEALLALKGNEVDLVLLDIMLKGKMDGVDVAHFIRDKYKIPFIFTSAFADETTLARAREESPYGYVVKPYGLKDIRAAIEIAMGNFIKEKDDIVPSLGEEVSKDHFYIKVDGRLVKIKETDLLYVEAKGDYMLFKTHEKGHVVHSTMKNVIEKLNPQKFLQVHRSYVVNLDHIKDIEDTTIVVEAKVIPVSRKNRSELMNRIRTI